MQLTKDLGQEIIKRFSEYIDVDINLMDLHGKIVASTDPSRIDETHSGAIEVMKRNEAVILHEHDMVHFPGTRPGVNLPILHQDKIKGVVGVSGNPAAIKQVTGIIRASVEIALEQIYIQRQTHFIERQWNQWIHQLLHPLGFDEEQLEKDAIYSLKINPKQNLRVIIFHGDNIHHNLDLIRKEMNGLKITLLFAVPFLENEIIVAVDPTFDRIQQLADTFPTKGQIQVGVGNVEFGIKGLRASYLQAKQALKFMREKSTGVSFINEWNLERLVAAIPIAEYQAVCKNYAGLMESLGADYIKTVDTYLSMNFSMKETAATLHIHRNTLLYRLDQIKGKVGLDPRSFHDAFLLKVMLGKGL
ncbi:sugar diacid recognition domain-containing protein [Lentibacillus sp. N15]|uniref:CdaR family transcriptional regulator n=1 Tax=Lentibacillus songyuanensis TaxID=3136161 RepID=UPI0031BB9E84